MKKKSKIVLILILILAVLCAAAVALLASYHKIYMFVEEKGLFCDTVDVDIAQNIESERISLESVLSDERFTVNQSLMLVNTIYMLPQDFEAEVSEYKDTTVFMNDCIMSAYEELSRAVLEKTGNKLYVSSSVRDREEQQALYLEDPLTATVPGASEHETGLSLDVYVARFSGDGFLRSKSGRFVNSHCWEYGFIIRYPSYGETYTNIRYEPWHIRYVGHPHSDIIYNNHLTLEQYILSLEPGVFYETGEYIITRQEAVDSMLTIPSGCDSYVISPDNTGYYIVTAKLAE